MFRESNNLSTQRSLKPLQLWIPTQTYIGQKKYWNEHFSLAKNGRGQMMVKKDRELGNFSNGCEVNMRKHTKESPLMKDLVRRGKVPHRGGKNRTKTTAFIRICLIALA